MLFNSPAFILFLLVVFSAYYLNSSVEYQKNILIAASLFFYAWANPWFLILLLGSAAINIYVSFQVVNVSKSAKLYAVAGVIFNLVLLIFFKYGRLVSSVILPGNRAVDQFLLNLPLAIGISFYTFEGISLVVDVFKKKENAVSISIVPFSVKMHSGNILLFITFFPHLIAGPVLKAHSFIPQIKTKYFNNIDWEYCFCKLILGYFLKMVIADNLKDQTFWIAYPYFQGHSSFTLIVLIIGYSAQIFSDFAGYSFIALGLAGLFGYQLEKNFNFPYIAVSFSEFWKRWHISLSGFLKEYLYIPLGGNRKGIWRTYFNLMITMLLGGLWHGAAWSYAIWGGFHGVALVTEKLFSGFITLPDWWGIRWLRRLLIFILISVAWLFFKLPDINDVVAYAGAIMHNTRNYNDYSIIIFTILYSLPVFFLHILFLSRNTFFGNLIIKKMSFVWYGLMLFAILVNSGNSGSFIYFQF